MTNPAEALAPFRVAKVLTAEKHPQADKLQVLSVDAGTGEPIQVVCGAPNARAGMIGVFGAARRLRPRQRHDAEGRGDPRSREPRHDVLDRASSSLATTIAASSSCPRTLRSAPPSRNMPGSTIRCSTCSITPNRQDCMGVHGIARDLAAAGMGTLKPLGVPQIEGSFPCPGRDADRRYRGLPGLLWPSDQRPEERRLARLDAAAAQGRRAAADLRAGRHHQLCDDRPRPAAPRLRHRQAERRISRARAASPARRSSRSTRRNMRSNRP